MCLVDSVLSGFGERALSSLLKLDITTDVFHQIFLRFNCTCFQIFLLIATSVKSQLGPSILYGKSHQLKQTYQKLLALYLLLFSVDFCGDLPNQSTLRYLSAKLLQVPQRMNRVSTISFSRSTFQHICLQSAVTQNAISLWLEQVIIFPVEINTWN